MNGDTEDVGAAALGCKLRASPVVHINALYSALRPFSHLANDRADDLHLPSPHDRDTCGSGLVSLLFYLMYESDSS